VQYADRGLATYDAITSLMLLENEPDEKDCGRAQKDKEIEHSLSILTEFV
jgi:hypothetical protein